MSTPLARTSAARLCGKVVKVGVAFSVTPAKNKWSTDAGANVSLTDRALLRFTPASTTPPESQLPCD